MSTDQEKDSEDYLDYRKHRKMYEDLMDSITLLALSESEGLKLSQQQIVGLSKMLLSLRGHIAGLEAVIESNKETIEANESRLNIQASLLKQYRSRRH